MSASAAILQKIANARASGGGNIIKDGKYELIVKQMLIEGKFGGQFFIVEFFVKTAERVLDDVTPNKEGTTVSYVVNLEKNLSAPGNTKAFTLALLGFREDEVSESDLMETLGRLVDTAQPARGMRIDTETFRKTIRGGPNAGKPFTAQRWTHVAQTAEEIASARKILDLGDKKPAA